MEGCGKKSESFFLVLLLFVKKYTGGYCSKRRPVSWCDKTSWGRQRGARGKIQKKSREWTNVTTKKVRLSASIVLVVDRKIHRFLFAVRASQPASRDE